MIDCHKLMAICFKPRVNLNLFDEGTKVISPTGTPLKNKQGGGGRGDDSDEDDEGGEGGITSPVLQNDPLRQYAEGSKLNGRNGGNGSSSSLNGSGEVGGGGGGGGTVKYYRRGVGSVSSKMLAHYRQLALQERRDRGIPAPLK
jgi:hypothetical protein